MELLRANSASPSSRPFQREVVVVLAFIGLIWAAFFLNALLPLRLERFALLPRQWAGLPGIVAMPFVHADLRHLLSNTVPLLVLLFLLVGSRARTWQIVLAILLGSGSLLWVAGLARHVYVGASMLIFGLIGFLIPAGFLEKRPLSLLVSLLVGFMYGGTFLVGMMPLREETSELAHFYGAVTGVALAFLQPRGSPSARVARTAESS